MEIKHMVSVYNKMAKNFMTPEVLKHEFVGNRIVELSQGTGFKGEDIFGVSEFVYKSSKLESTERAEMFYTKKEALKYYAILLHDELK